MRRLVLTDLDRGTVHEFRDADVRIGRDPACELPVVEAPAGAEIAGVHARLAPRATGWCLTDERTKGGTFVNHVRLVGSDQAILRTGDVIRLGAGAGARRYRVARIENVAAPKQAPPPARASTTRDEAADIRLAAGAVGGASVATAAALAPRATNAQLAGGAAAGTVVATAAAGVAAGRAKSAAAQSSGNGSANVGVAAAAGAVAGTAGVAGVVSGVSGNAGGLEQWRASRLFEAAGDSGQAATAAAKGGTSAGVWTGVTVGAMAVAGAAGGYQMWRSDTNAGPRVVIASVAETGTPAASRAAATAGTGAMPSAGTPSADAADAARATAAARLGAAAGAAGNLIADVTAYYGGRRVRLTGVVLAESGALVSVREAVRNGAGAKPDSVIVGWPHGGRHRAVPKVEADGLGLLTLQAWRGQWLGTAAYGEAGATPAWTAVVGFDRDDPRPVVVAAEAAATQGASGLDVRGASERLLPGSALVDAQGHVVGVWLGAGKAAPLAAALRLVER